MDEKASTDKSSVGLLAWPLIFIVHFYQAVLGQFFGGHCRFHPTCSNYAVKALQEHGAFRGAWLTLKRLLRCHPFGGAGYDPVPPSDSK